MLGCALYSSVACEMPMLVLVIRVFLYTLSFNTYSSIPIGMSIIIGGIVSSLLTYHGISIDSIIGCVGGRLNIALIKIGIIASSIEGYVNFGSVFHVTWINLNPWICVEYLMYSLCSCYGRSRGSVRSALVIIPLYHYILGRLSRCYHSAHLLV